MTTRVSAEVRSIFRSEGLRLGVAAAVVVLALASRGDALVLFALAAAVSTRPTALAALALAAVGASWRWGASALVAWSGDQAVLGPAGLVGPTSAAAASWLAAAAVLLAVAHPSVGVLRRHHAPFTVLDQAQCVVAGLVAGLTVAGPGPGGDLWIRVVAAVVAVAAAVGLSTARARWRRLDSVLGVGAIVVGAGALGTAAIDAPAWEGTVTGEPIRDAVVLAVAAIAVVAVLRRGLEHRRAPRWAAAADRP